MKKLLATTFAAGLGLLMINGSALAGPKVKTSLAPSIIVPEMANSSGKVLSLLDTGRVDITVADLPKNDEGSPLPITLTDLSPVPALKLDVKSYDVSLLRVQTVDGRWIIRNAMNIGKLKVNRNGSGRAKLKKAGDLSGFNIVAVTAEHQGESDGHRWRMSEDFSRSYVSGDGSTGLVVLWGQLGPIE